MFFQAMPGEVNPHPPGPSQLGTPHADESDPKKESNITIEPSIHASGGIAAFATGTDPLPAKIRDTSVEDGEELQPDAPMEEHTSLTQGMLAVAEDCAKTQTVAAESKSVDEMQPSAETPVAACVPVAEGHFVQIFPFEADQPYLIKVDPQATIGSITVAEAKLGSMTQPIRANMFGNTGQSRGNHFSDAANFPERNVHLWLHPESRVCHPSCLAKVLCTTKDHHSLSTGIMGSTG